MHQVLTETPDFGYKDKFAIVKDKVPSFKLSRRDI